MSIVRCGASVVWLALMIDVVVVAYTEDLGRFAQTSGVKETPGRGKLFGNVKRRPTCHGERQNKPCPSEPASGVKLWIFTTPGQKIKSVVTDNQGRYRIRLRPGSYRIEMAPLGSLGWTKDLPATVTIVEGRQKRMDIFIASEDRKMEPQRATGVLTGIVTRGPVSPVEGLGGFRARVPVPGTSVIISGLDGKEIKSGITDDRGGYTISLLPGTYRVEMAPLAGAGWTKDLPTTISITEGQETRLDIRIDTGLR